MNRLFGILLVLLTTVSHASTLYLEADGLRNPLHTKSYLLPAIVGSSDTFATATNTQTFSGKTIDGGSNTITNVSLSSGVTGTLPTANGGTGQTSLNSTVFTALYETITTTLGDLIYGGASGAPTRVAGNTTSTKKFFTQTGTGTVSAAPGWNTIAGSDLPNPSSSTLGGVQSAAAVSHQWINSISTSGVPALSQPAFTDVSGTAIETQGGTNQTTYALGDTLYSSSANTLSKLSGNTTSTKKYLSQTGTGTVSAAPSWAQIAFGDLSGSVTASQMPALTGDITTSAGAVATTLATVNSNVGSFGSASLVPVITVNGKGLITAVTTASAVTSVAHEGTQTAFFTNGTFTTPSDSSSSTIYGYVMVAGGGGGGGASGVGGQGVGAGGGCGGGAMGTFTGVAANTGITITVSNTAAAGGGATGATGTTGGSSSIGSPVSVTVTGGAGGTGTTTSGSSAVVGGAGGSVTVGSPAVSWTGGQGNSGLTISGTFNLGGSGCSGPWGSGGAGAMGGGANVAGSAAKGYGSGGGGGQGAQVSTAGSPGLVVITQLTP